MQTKNDLFSVLAVAVVVAAAALLLAGGHGVGAGREVGNVLQEVRSFFDLSRNVIGTV